MSCPNCATPMSLVTLDNQNILHCGNCGGTFFEENGINRISLSSAQKLADDKQTDEVAGTDKKCPKDQTVLKPISNEENIPADITLLHCATCNGVFSYPDDLMKFKQAQEAKVNYFKLWSIPLPTLRSVLVISFTAVAAISLFSSVIFWQQGQLGPTQATDVAKTVNANRSGPYLFMSFRTATPLYSIIIFQNKTTNTTITKIVSDKLTKLHYITTTDVNLNDEITYQIVLTDENGKQVKTEKLLLQLK